MTIVNIPLRDAAYKQADDMDRLQGLAKKTRVNTISAYHRFAAYLEDRFGREPMTSDYTYQNLEDYFRDKVSAQADGTYRTTRSQHIAIVKWLMKRGYIPWGPNFAEDVAAKRKTVTTTRNRRFTDDEFLKFAAAAKRSHARDYFLSLVVRLTGRRIGELVGENRSDYDGIRWGDIRWSENVIIWNNYKGRRHGEQMPLTPRLRAVLEAWREEYARQVGVEEILDHWFVFPALTGVGRVSKGHRRQRTPSPTFRFTNTDKAFRKIMDYAGLIYEKGDGWHVIRKTFGNQRKIKAREMGRADAMELAKNSLSHRDESTTRVYLDENEERDRYMSWAMEAEELSLDAMAKIPELAALAEAAQTAKTPASEPEPTKSADRVSANVVDISAFARRRGALA